MKNINEILNHLKQNPQFRRINTNEQIQKLIDILPSKLKKGIKFTYIKDNILYFVLTHPVFKMEFEYNKILIKSLLTTVNINNVKEIKVFITNKKEKKEKKQKEEKYKERSFGIFENNISDLKLYNIFESIRKIIKNP